MNQISKQLSNRYNYKKSTIEISHILQNVNEINELAIRCLNSFFIYHPDKVIDSFSFDFTETRIICSFTFYQLKEKS